MEDKPAVSNLLNQAARKNLTRYSSVTGLATVLVTRLAYHFLMGPCHSHHAIIATGKVFLVASASPISNLRFVFFSLGETGLYTSSYLSWDD